jgi:hypothetical protein
VILAPWQVARVNPCGVTVTANKVTRVNAGAMCGADWCAPLLDLVVMISTRVAEPEMPALLILDAANGVNANTVIPNACGIVAAWTVMADLLPLLGPLTSGNPPSDPMHALVLPSAFGTGNAHHTVAKEVMHVVNEPAGVRLPNVGPEPGGWIATGSRLAILGLKAAPYGTVSMQRAWPAPDIAAAVGASGTDGKLTGHLVSLGRGVVGRAVDAAPSPLHGLIIP